MKRTTVEWADVPGVSDLETHIRSGVLPDHALLDKFIVDEPSNPLPVDAYVYPERGRILVLYYDERGGELRFVRSVPDTEGNRAYLVYELSDLGVPEGMTLEN